MRHFNNLSLKNKLTFMAMLTCGAVLLLSSAIFVGTEIVVQRRAVVEELETLGEIIANNSTAAIIFQDRESLDEILGALEAKPNITSASIFGRDGKVLVDYPSGQPLGDLSENIVEFQQDPTSLAVTVKDFSVVFRDGFAELTAPIIFDSEFIGLLTIRYGLERMYGVIKIYIFASMAVVVLSFFMAFLLFSKMQEFISRPIRALLGTMREVSEDQDYALRAQPHGDDEIGKLIIGFNEMLEQIQAHEIYLSEARRQAETANRAKTEFLANMSHELRTPLNAVLGFSEILMRELFGPIRSKKYQGYAVDIHDSGHLLLGVINDVLDISKVEAGKIELTEEEVDLNDLVKQSMRLVKQRARDAGVKLTVSVEKKMPRLYADERLVRQTLLNLLSNAVKFTPKGGQVDLRLEGEADGSLAFSVSDTGIGIAEEDIEQILTPFGQVESAFSRKYRGTGLGLPLAKSFIELHGGTLEIHSEQDAGTEVTVRFPPERTCGAKGDDDAQRALEGPKT